MPIRSYKPRYSELLLGLFGTLPSAVCRLPGTPEELSDWLSQPRLDSARDIWLVFEDDRATGYVIVNREVGIGRAVLNLGVAPARGSDIYKLLKHAEGCVTQQGLTTIHIPAWERSGQTPDGAFENGLAQAGYKKVRRYLRMVAKVDTSIHSVAHPRFEFIRAEESDISTLALLQNRIFEGHFGYQPNTTVELAHSLRAKIHNGWCWLAKFGNRSVGFVYVMPTEDGEGWLEMMGVAPDCRGQGLGKALATKGLSVLERHGCQTVWLEVDGNNVGATATYAALGFRQRQAYGWWEKRF